MAVETLSSKSGITEKIEICTWNYAAAAPGMIPGKVVLWYGFV